MTLAVLTFVPTLIHDSSIVHIMVSFVFNRSESTGSRGKSSSKIQLLS
jgi:hypothetical protein